MNEYKNMVDKDREHCSAMVKEWERKLKEATSQLEYWKRQEEAVRTVSTRLMLDGWKKE